MDEQAKILLVEDDDIDAENVRRAFIRAGINNEMTRVRDGLQALEILEKYIINPPNLFLIDINMPRMNGLELLAELRKSDRYTDSKIFILTTSENQKDKLTAYKLGIAGYCIKENINENFDEIVKLF